MVQSLMILVVGFTSFTIANHLNKIKIVDMETKNEMDRHYESMANLIINGMKEDKIKKQYRLIELYEEEIMRLESLNDNLLNELKYKDILGGS